MHLRHANLALLSACLSTAASARALPVWDIVIRGGSIYDGSGRAPSIGDVAVAGDRIAAIGPHLKGHGKTEIDARGKAVSPGFINMLAHPEETLLVDGRALSDLTQGVTLEVIGEGSMGPLSSAMKAQMVRQQGDLKFTVTWTTLGEYMGGLERRGIAPNVASFVGEGTVRTNVLGETSVQPTPAQLVQMRGFVRHAMEEGAMGLTTALIYTPNTFAKTPELIAMAQESALCGGMYIAHMRSEGDRFIEAIQETIDIAKASGAPAEIYHLKQAGRDNWAKLTPAIAMIEAARANGTRITADMYLYTAGATGLDASMPAWVQDGGLDKWVERLRDPAIRARVAAEMRNAHPADWENLYAGAGPDGVVVLEFKNPALRPLAGKSLAEIARIRGKTPEETAMDLVVEDNSRVGTAYFLMTEDNVKRQVALPWVSFGSDAGAPAPEGVFLQSKTHPRTYGNFARLLAKYVRDEHVIPLEEAVRKLTSFSAETLSIKDRGRLQPGFLADIVVFDPKTIQDHATFANAHQLSTGVDDVLVNGGFALRDGKATGAATGRFVHGRAWTGASGGGCRASAADWTWSR